MGNKLDISGDYVLAPLALEGDFSEERCLRMLMHNLLGDVR
jgi:hypothetical protein